MSLTKRQSGCKRQRGTSLLEVLITIIILAFGLLGLAGLQAKIQLAETESFQRAQAMLLLSDMVQRFSANSADAATYVAAAALVGTDDAPLGNCTGSGAARDVCEWRNALKGAGEKTGSANTGAMLGGRGCVTQVQVPDPSPGVCLPGVYRVTVVWQGLSPTAAPSLTCGQGAYDPDTTRRAMAALVTVGLPNCI
ncbi:MAG: type IV pilus modification protein PilV [Gallionellales bacterium RIFCSPLOWO2_12_FULL_59_22]|nr:MAG: type IV pilus modification protein PilV [Gallionellales bacterium RIFCSPLOWO2_02_FULL_59_110]OGT04655.1 MAG: type IV pilus modification protein PilV [Gallionellales bacterium RIFCSPLOWO2_02_58_13]OGT13418.1 MAG: type IV pilus modification protein PilV [Gallionellales bacterium RIFCSPLOWO2_12_FULL_59_22]